MEKLTRLIVYIVIGTALGCASSPPETEHLVTRDRGESYQGVQREQIRGVVVSGMPGVRECYTKELKTKAGLGGKIVVRWVISEDGTVKSADIKSSTVGSPSLESCVVSQVKKWKFEPLAKGKEAEVMYPFVFFSSEPKAP